MNLLHPRQFETPFLAFWRMVAEATEARGLPRMPGSDVKRCFDAEMGITETAEAWQLQVEHAPFEEVA